MRRPASRMPLEPRPEFGVAGCEPALVDVVRAVDGNVELDGEFGEQIANEIHIAAVVLFKRVGLDEGIEADEVRLAALDSVAQLRL